MSDGGINERHKQRWAEATKANGGDPHLPWNETQRLQEMLRLEWVTHVKGTSFKTEPKDQEDDLQEAEGTQEEDPGDAEGQADGEPGEEDDVIAPRETLETTRGPKAGGKRSGARSKGTGTRRQGKG